MHTHPQDPNRTVAPLSVRTPTMPTQVVGDIFHVARLERAIGRWRDEANRTAECLAAVRALPWWRRGILLRRPWRVISWGDAVTGSWERAGWRGPVRLTLYWLLHEHDCGDPAVACTCPFSYRNPTGSRAGDMD